MNDIERQRIKSAVRLMSEVTRGRAPSPEALEAWARALEKHIGPRLWKVLEDSTHADSMPSISEVLNRVIDKRSSSQPPQHKRPTKEEEIRINLSATLSMLWLHYVKGWVAKDFAGSIFAKTFKMQVGTTPEEALETAKARYSREDVLKWAEYMEQRT